MICRWCGKELEDNVYFCNYCGHRVYEEDMTVTAQETPASAGSFDSPAQTPLQQQTDYTAEPAQENRPPQPSEYAYTPVINAWQPSENSYAVPSEEKKTTPVKVKKKSSVGAILLSILVSLLLFVIGLGLSAILTVRHTLDRDTLTSVVEKIDFTEMTVRDEEGDVLTLPELLDDNAGELLDYYNIKPSRVVDLLNSSYVKRFINKILQSYSDYFLAGQKLSPLSRDSVLDFFEDNNDRIIEESKGLIYFLGNGQSYVPGVRMYISEQDVDDFFDALGTRSLNASAIRKMTGIDPDLIVSALSSTTVLILAVVAGLFGLILLLINYRSLNRGFAFLGTTAILVGGVLVAAYFVAKPKVSALGYSAAVDFTAPMFSYLLKAGFLLLLAGFVLAVPIALIIRLITKKIRKAA